MEGHDAISGSKYPSMGSWFLLGFKFIPRALARVQRHRGFLRGEALLLPLGFTRGFIPRVKCNLSHYTR